MATFEILRNVGALIALLGTVTTALVGFAFWLFKKFGDRWLTAKFDERLEDYKHAQQKELETLRFKINTLFDRTTKLHQHEFEVLPEIWALLTESYSQTAHFTSPFQQYPDLNRMTEAHLAEFLQKSPLQDWQKGELLKQGDKTREYMKQIFWHDLNRVRKTYAEFQAYLVKNGIFIQPDLKARLKILSDMLFDAIYEKQFEEENPVPRAGRFEKGDRFRKDGPAILSSVENEIYERLWDASLRV